MIIGFTLLAGYFFGIGWIVYSYSPSMIITAIVWFIEFLLFLFHAASFYRSGRQEALVTPEECRDMLGA